MPSDCATRPRRPARRRLQRLCQDTLQDYYEEAVTAAFAAGPDLRTEEQETETDDLQFLHDLDAAIAASIDGMDVSDLVEQVSAWELGAESGSNVQPDQSLGAVASDGSDKDSVISAHSGASGTIIVSANDDDRDSTLDTLSFASYPDDESHKEAGRDDDDPSIASSCWEEIPETGSVFSMNSFQMMTDGTHRPISYRNALLLSKTPKPPVVSEAARSWVQEQSPKKEITAFPFQLRPTMPKIDEDVDNDDDFGQDQWDAAKNMRGGKAGFQGNARTPWAPTTPGLRAYLNHTRPNVARNKRKVAL